jgi:hypothetical protein
MSLLKRAITCGGVLLALSACEHGDPVSTAGGERGHGILLSGAPSAATLPSGSATVTTQFGGFLTSIQDAFGRRQSDATRARRTRNFRATAHYWTWTHELRDGATPTRKDPRLPVIDPTSAIADGSQYFELYQPEGTYPGKEFREFYFIVHNLAPSTPHEVAFVHRRLQVNGELDAVEMILNGSVSQPDQLVLAPGTKATINTDWSDPAPAGCAAFPGPTANPFVVSTDPSDASGALQDFDKCWKSGNGIWTKPEFDQPAKSMVGRADDQTYSLPNYNYIEVWEGAFGTGKLKGRVQIAQDLTPAGKPIANAYPPFPAPGGARSNSQMGPIPAVDLATSFPIDATLKASLPGAVGVPTNVVATLNNVQKLGAPVYKAWFINATSGVAKEAAGHYVRTVGSTNVEDVASTTTFKGGPGTITFTAPYSTTTHGPYADSLTFLVITKEDNAAATTPSLSQPLWVKIFKIPPANAGGSFTFGNFNRDSLPTAGDTSRHPVVFVPQGAATGGVLGDTVTVMVQQSNGTLTRSTVFQGSKLEMKFTNLQRPPKGYEYLGYFRQKRDTTAATPTVVNRDSTLVFIGGLRGVAGESLSDADVAARGGNLGPNTIAVARLDVDAAPYSAGLCTFDRFRLYLAPKGGVSTEPRTLIFDLALPAKVTTAASCR